MSHVIVSLTLVDDLAHLTLRAILLKSSVQLYMENIPFGAHVFHTDTTNFSVYGNYENLDSELNTIEITYSHIIWQWKVMC